MKNTEFAVWVVWLAWAAGLNGVALWLYTTQPQPPPPPPPPPPPVVAFSQPTQRVAAGAASAEIELRLDREAGRKIEVTLDVEGAEAPEPARVVFERGEASKKWRLPLGGSPRTVTVRIIRADKANVGQPAEQQITIEAEQPKTEVKTKTDVNPKTDVKKGPPLTVTVRAVGQRVRMPVKQVELTVELSGPAPRKMAISYRVTGDKKVFAEPEDVTFDRGETQKVIGVRVQSWIDSKPRTVKVELVASDGVVLGTPASATVEVSAEPPPMLALKAPATGAEGEEVTVTVSLSRPLDQPVALTWTLSGMESGKDYTAKDQPEQISKKEAAFRVKFLKRDDLPPNRTLTIRCEAKELGATAEAKVRLSADDSKRDVLVLVLATTKAKSDWKKLSAELAKLKTDLGDRLVGGEPLLVAKKGDKHQWKRLPTDADFPFGDELLFGEDERVDNAVNRGVAAWEELALKTKARGNTNALAVYLVWRSDHSPDNLKMGEAEKKAAPVTNEKVCFAWVGAPKDMRDAVAEGLFPTPKGAVRRVLYIEEKDSTAKELSKHLDVLSKP